MVRILACTASTMRGQTRARAAFLDKNQSIHKTSGGGPLRRAPLRGECSPSSSEPHARAGGLGVRFGPSSTVMPRSVKASSHFSWSTVDAVSTTTPSSSSVRSCVLVWMRKSARSLLSVPVSGAEHTSTSEIGMRSNSSWSRSPPLTMSSSRLTCSSACSVDLQLLSAPMVTCPRTGRHLCQDAVSSPAVLAPDDRTVMQGSVRRSCFGTRCRTRIS